MKKSAARPGDSNQLAKMIVDIATGKVDDPLNGEAQKKVDVARDRLGGFKGGKAKAQPKK